MTKSKEESQEEKLRFNQISVADITIISHTQSLKECKAILDEIIKEHSSFIFSKRNEFRLDRAVGVG